MLRDLFGPDVERVRVDAPAEYARMTEFAERFMPHMAASIELYAEDRPLFDLYGVEDEIARALNRKVALKSGGHVVIDQTEAMTTIDVNTGAYVGHRNLEETIFRTNLEAAVVIARQLRLRNLGGIIIIDFIDMVEEEHRHQVLQALSARLANDHAKTQIMSVSPLGLVEMTRKRNRESLEHVLCQACPSCEGRGFVKSPETVCYEIFREILRQHRQFEFQELLVLARPDVIDINFADFSGPNLPIDRAINSEIVSWFRYNLNYRCDGNGYEYREPVFILPPSREALEQRMRARGQDSDEVIARRLAAAREEMSHYDEFDYVIVNEVFDVAVEEMCAIFRASRLRLEPQQLRHKALIQALVGP